MYEIISYTFSVISIIFYSIVYVPQIYEIYNTQNTDGMSTSMLLLWNQADCLSLISTLLLKLPLSLVLLGWYHAFVGCIMLTYILYVKYVHNRLIKFEILYCILFYIINYSIALIFNIRSDIEVSELIGLILASITMILYIIGRIPQIYLNNKTLKNKMYIEGLSRLMFLFTLLGNIFYVASVFAYSLEYNYVIKNVPWLVGTFITVSFDLIVMFQINKSKKYKLNKLDELPV